MFHCSAAQAVGSACEFLFKRDYHQDYDVSRLFLFYNGQILSERSHQVHHWGVNQRHIILGMRKYGFCEEELWRYSPRLLNIEPPKEIYDRASYYTVVPFHLPCTIEAIEKCLYHRIPVPMNIILLDHARSAVRANHGLLPVPDLNRIHINEKDLHTILLVGYDRNRQYFIARNSYGREWVNNFILFHLIY